MHGITAPIAEVRRSALALTGRNSSFARQGRCRPDSDRREVGQREALATRVVNNLRGILKTGAVGCARSELSANFDKLALPWTRCSGVFSGEACSRPAAASSRGGASVSILPLSR